MIVLPPTTGEFLLILTVLFGLGVLVPLPRPWRESEQAHLAEGRGRQDARPLHWSVRASLVLALVGSLFAFAVAGGVSFGLDGFESAADCAQAPLAQPEPGLACSTVRVAEFALGPPGSAMTLDLAVRLDRLGAFFALIISGFSALVAIYSFGALKARHYRAHGHRITAAFNAFVWSTLLVVLVADLLSLLVALELMSLSFGYLALFKHLLFEAEDAEERKKPEPLKLTNHDINKRHDAWLAPQVYLMTSHVSTAFLLIAASILALHADNLLFAELSASAGRLDSSTASLVFLLTLAGLGIRIGLSPSHVWVPLVHPASPTPTHALSLGIAIKVGVYLMFRFFFEFTVPQAWWGYILLSVAGLTALVNVWYAIASHDLKEALAYHSIENIGIITAGVGIALIFVPADPMNVPAAPWIAALALVASLYHLLNHAVFKGLLYMATGSIDYLTGRVVDFDQLGGLMRRYRWTSAAFILGALAISGFPLLNGFVSEWLTLQAMFSGLMQGQPVATAVLMLALILFVGSFALTAFCFFKMVGLVFLGRTRATGSDRRDWTPAGRDSPWSMLGPIAAMGVLCLVLGLVPGAVVPWLEDTARPYLTHRGELHDPGRDGAVGGWLLVQSPAYTGLELSKPLPRVLASKPDVKLPSPALPTIGLLCVIGALAVIAWLSIRIAAMILAGAEGRASGHPWRSIADGIIEAAKRGRVERPDLAWNCGTDYSPGRMQYTAASLSDLVRHLGNWPDSQPKLEGSGAAAGQSASDDATTESMQAGDVSDPEEPSEADRTERIILREWYLASKGYGVDRDQRYRQYVREFFRAGYNRLSRWIYGGSSRFGNWVQGGDIRLYVRFILVTQIAILLLFMIIPHGGAPG